MAVIPAHTCQLQADLRDPEKIEEVLFKAYLFRRSWHIFWWQNVVANKKDANGGWISCHPCTLLFRNELFLLDYWNYIIYIYVQYMYLFSFEMFFYVSIFTQNTLIQRTICVAVINIWWVKLVVYHHSRSLWIKCSRKGVLWGMSYQHASKILEK